MSPFRLEVGDALEVAQSLPDKHVSLSFFSPPYENCRLYGPLSFKLVGQAWVDWMRAIVRECCRVTDGLVIVNAAGPVRTGSYSPSMEWLVADLTRLDGVVCGPAPWAWYKVAGTPGSGGTRQQRRDWEPLYSFCLPDRLPLRWTDNTAFGAPPKYGAGGAFSHRAADGTRAGGGEYEPPKLANPGNFIQAAPDEEGGATIQARVGGGHLGSPLAHECEAPMPLAVAERFVRWYCPLGGTVFDCFAGSGTTGHACLLHGRRFLGVDARPEMVELAGRRLGPVAEMGLRAGGSVEEPARERAGGPGAEA